MWVFLTALLIASGSPDAHRVTSPHSVPSSELYGLTGHGELLLLPKHQTSPFHAYIVSISPHSCDNVERIAMTVTDYPLYWPHMREGVKVLQQEPRKIRYSFKLDVIFSPTIEGVVENPKPHQIVFWDPESNGKFTWDLLPQGNECIMVYDLYQPKGKQSGFVSLVQHFEKDVADAAELAGGIATARGYAKDRLYKGKAPNQSAYRETWMRLASSGTVLRTVPRKDKIMRLFAARRISDRPSDVARRIRSRNTYPQQLDFLSDASQKGQTTQWKVSYFGGRVNFETRSNESGSLQPNDRLLIRESVVSGDISQGEWEWRLTPVDGGTEVELMLDLDLTQGSRILGTLAAQDPLVRDAALLQMALKMMGNLIGGEHLSAPSQVPPNP